MEMDRKRVLGRERECSGGRESKGESVYGERVCVEERKREGE